MNAARPFSGPASVSLAGLTLIALAAASFTSGLWRQLDRPRPDHSARVVLISPTEPPPAAPVGRLTMASLAAAPTAALARAPVPRRHARATADLAPSPAPAEPGLAPAAATGAATETTAVAPIGTPVAAAPDPPSDAAPPF